MWGKLDRTAVCDICFTFTVSTTFILLTLKVFSQDFKPFLMLLCQRSPNSVNYAKICLSVSCSEGLCCAVDELRGLTKTIIIILKT